MIKLVFHVIQHFSRGEIYFKYYYLVYQVFISASLIICVRLKKTDLGTTRTKTKSGGKAKRTRRTSLENEKLNRMTEEKEVSTTNGGSTTNGEGGASNDSVVSNGGGGGHDDSVNGEHDPYYPPIVSLPEVKVPTGEDGEEEIFKVRARTFTIYIVLLFEKLLCATEED